jgi:hypothetical protein
MSFFYGEFLPFCEILNEKREYYLANIIFFENLKNI